MSTKDTGGQAFPLADSCCEYGGTNRSDANGMSLRDYFAAKAMAALIAKFSHPEDVARLAHQHADAMLKARGA